MSEHYGYTTELAHRHQAGCSCGLAGRWRRWAWLARRDLTRHTR